MNTEEILQCIPSDKRDIARQEIVRLQKHSIPFHINALVFVGALLAAGYFSRALDLYDIKLPRWELFILFCSSGWGLSYLNQLYPNVWLCQFGEVLTLLGQGSLLMELQMADWNILLANLVVAIGSYPLFRSFFNRLLLGMNVAVTFYMQVNTWGWDPVIRQAVSIILFAGGCGILLTRKKTFYPMAIALVGAGVLCCFEKSIWTPGFSALAAGVAAYIFFLMKNFSRKNIFLAVLLVVAGAALPLSCVLGMILFYVGFLLRERILEYVGVLCLAAGMSHFYYLLEIPLTAKAGLLLFSGLILLWVRQKYTK